MCASMSNRETSEKRYLKIGYTTAAVWCTYFNLANIIYIIYYYYDRSSACTAPLAEAQMFNVNIYAYRYGHLRDVQILIILQSRTAVYRKTAAATAPARKKLPESISIGWSFMTTGGGGDEYIILLYKYGSGILVARYKP